MDFAQQVEPVFSIHIPGDYESVQYLLDEYEDNIKKAKFCSEKLKQYQIDNYKPEDKE